MATSGKQWKHTVEITLPNSGYTVEIRPLGFDLILKCDHVPDVITAMVVKAFKGEEVRVEVEEFKQASDYASFLDTCCALCFVHPRVVERPEGEDEISADMLEFDDKAFVFSLLGKSRRWLEAFRDESARDVPTQSEDGALSPTGEPDAPAQATSAA